MSVFSEDAEAFSRAVVALEPYLQDVVFVGGWAHYLYTLHPSATPVPFEPLRTLDADVAAPLGLPTRGETIAARLRAAGFVQEFKGDEIPPVCEYRLGEESGGFYLEFLAPLRGAERDRWGNRNATTDVGGVSAQTLRHLDVLLIDPWEVVLSEVSGFPLGRDGRHIRIANPVSFIVQKVLVLKDRPLKQGKDFLYLHDTLQLFADATPELRTTWASVASQMHKAHVATFMQTASNLTSAVTDAARGASRIARESGRSPAPTPEDVTATCRAGYAAVFS